MPNLSKIIPALTGAGILFLVVAGVPTGAPVPSSAAAVLRAANAFAEESGWKEDFDDICAKTQDAMTLTPDELRVLVKRCDELKVKVDALDGPAKKVALKRLQMCRDLYAYVLEQKEKK